MLSLCRISAVVPERTRDDGLDFCLLFGRPSGASPGNEGMAAEGDRISEISSRAGVRPKDCELIPLGGPTVPNHQIHSRCRQFGALAPGEAKSEAHFEQSVDPVHVALSKNPNLTPPRFENSFVIQFRILALGRIQRQLKAAQDFGITRVAAVFSEFGFCRQTGNPSGFLVACLM